MSKTLKPKNKISPRRLSGGEMKEGVFVALRITEAAVLYWLVLVVSRVLTAGISYSFIWPALISKVFAIGAVLLFVLFFDRLSFLNLGIFQKKIVFKLSRGAMVAFAAFFILSFIFGSKPDWKFFLETYDYVYLTAIFVLCAGFLQASSEELLFRGYILGRVTSEWNIWIGVAVSSLLFSALHVFNPGMSVLVLLNLVLFGAFCAVYKTFVDDGAIWGVFGFHAVWNLLPQFQRTPFNAEGMYVSSLLLLGMILLVFLLKGKIFDRGKIIR